jgi:hypothetical protein
MVLSVDRLPATTFCGVLNKCPAANLVAANVALRCDRDIVAASELCRRIASNIKGQKDCGK